MSYYKLFVLSLLNLLKLHVADVVYKSSITLVFVSVVSDVKPYTEHSMFGCMRKAKFFWRKQKTLSAFFTFLSLSYSLLAFPRLHFCGKSLCENYEDRKNR